MTFDLTPNFLDGYKWFGEIRAKAARDEASSLTDSPIEAMLLTALLLHAHEVGLDYGTLDRDVAIEACPTAIYIAPQRRLGDYRVDFIIGNKPANKHVVVECDGADYHYATREQIERDRTRDAAIEAQGFKVLRFPGKQIYAEPFFVAGEIWHQVAMEEHIPWIRSFARYFK